ncbi:hypothetical protein HYU19_03885, partial [Candidatus Woesearchaeota archaeon]|nr:hypothetical protein [Candidatus Woesearchaeota archaeon]
MIRTSLPINRSLAIFCIFLLLFSNVLSAAAAGAPAQGSFAGASASKSASKQASHQGEIKLPKLPAKSSTKAALPPAVIGSNKAGKNNKEGRNNDGKNNNADTGRNNNAGKNKQGSKDGKAADSPNSPKIQSSKTPPLKTSASPPPLPAKSSNPKTPSSTLPPFSLPTPSSGKPAWSQGSASGSPSSPSGSPSIPPKIPPKQQPGATGLGSLSQPLMLPPPAEEEDNPFAITNVDVSSPVIAGQPFIITIIATDMVHSVDRIAFGTAPYHPENFAVISCPEPVSTTCTISLTRQENSTGSYTYKLLAHNTNGQTAADDITVSVSAEAETSRFILRTAAIDSEAFHASRKRVYLPNTSVTIRDSADGLVLASSPSPRTFSTFSLQSDALYLAEYSSPSYKPDTDVLFFDSRLPSCAGEECTFRSGERQTHCTFSNTKHAYVCELSGGREFAGTVSFEYYPAGDSLGDNVIRYYNHLFPANGPEIADMAPISIVQGRNATRNLNAFAADPDTPLRELSWTASADHVRATINSRSHVLTVTAPRDFIGNDVVVLTV